MNPPTFHPDRACAPRFGYRSHAAFSLVEVTLALGMVTFCLLGLVGLLPLGLTSVKSSRDGAAALNTLVQMSEAIQGAQVESVGNDLAFKGAGKYDHLEWKVGGSEVSSTTKLSALGFPVSKAQDERFVSRVVITPPTQATSAGTAAISIAWPSQATWDSAKGQWIGAQGSVRTWLVFLPATP